MAEKRKPDAVGDSDGTIVPYDWKDEALIDEETYYYSIESIKEIIEDWKGEPDPSGDRQVNKAAVKLAEELKERFQSL